MSEFLIQNLNRPTNNVKDSAGWRVEMASIYEAKTSRIIELLKKLLGKKLVVQKKFNQKCVKIFLIS